MSSVDHPADARFLWPSSPVRERIAFFLRHWRRWLALSFVVSISSTAFWIHASMTELQYGRRLWPWSAFALCGHSEPESVPATVRIGLYEEFPNPWRLAKLRQVDFPVTLAIAAPSREEFLRLRTEIQAEYPQVQEVLFWPTLRPEEGYYLGGLSSAAGIDRIIGESAGLPLLWDLELPRGITGASQVSIRDWWANRRTIGEFFTRHTEPIHTWRTHTSMGLNPAFLRLIGLHYDPLDYPNLRFHLDLYDTGAGRDPAQVRQIIRCGVERYGERFIPSLGVLNDNEGPANIFVPPGTFRRNLEIARSAGAHEIWIFGVNGLNEEYLAAVREVVPVE